MNEKNQLSFGSDEQGELVIRVDRSHFGDFVKGLLGQPQTIEAFFSGPFDLEKNDLVQLHHLLIQRVFQQNHGELLQFTALIAWDNSSSVLLNSFEDFVAYESVSDEITSNVRLTWTFLIQFLDKPAPEKQTIYWELDKHHHLPKSLEVSGAMPQATRGCTVRIEHTARTWGMDIENIISQKMRAWTHEEPWFKRIICRKSDYVGLVAGLVMLGLIASGLTAAMLHLEHQLSASAAAAKLLPDSQKLTFLIDSATASRFASRPEAFGGAIAILAMIVSLLVGIIIGSLANNPQKGFIVLSDADRKFRKMELEKRKKGWGYFIASGITAVVAGVLSRYLFLAWFGSVS